MAEFFLTASTNVAQTLGTGEMGVVAQGVTLFVPNIAASAVSMTGSARLTVLGAVVSENLDALSIASTTLAAVVSVGQAGTMLSSVGAAISGTVGASFFLNNAGVIQGAAEAIRLSGTSAGTVTFNLTNSGTIQSSGRLIAENTIEFGGAGGGTLSLTNAGQILNAGAGGGIVVANVSATIVNTGTIAISSVGSFAISLDFGNDTLRNSGSITGAMDLGLGSDSFINTGLVTGTVLLNDGTDTLTNYGRILGTVIVGSSTDNAADTVNNEGTIRGNVVLGAGNDTFRSEGGRIIGTVLGDLGDDLYVIDDSTTDIFDTSGTDEVRASVDFALGNSGVEHLVLTGVSGLLGQGNGLNNRITGNAGDDTLRGSVGNDTLSGDQGDNLLLGGKDNDLILSDGQSDTIGGGAGDDVIRLQGGNATVDGGTGFDAIDAPFLERVEVNLATGQGNAGPDAVWTLQGIEDVVSGLGNDVLTGNTLSNFLKGGGGDDILRGGGGDDFLVGAQGSDTMTGGAGQDVFLLFAAAESFVGLEDLIADFTQGQDLIDLSSVDSAPSSSAPFTFIGTSAFSGSKGEIRYFFDAASGRTIIELREEGSLSDDMQIFLTGNKVLTADDFVL